MTGRGFACVAALAIALLAACSRDDAGRPPEHDAGLPPGAGGESIYDLELPLLDADGGTLRLADLRDTVRVAALMYTSCQSVCPRITHDMKGIERQLAPKDARGVGFVLFSLDPERDSPEAMRGFARTFDLDPSRWRLFATSEEGVRDLAAVLGVKYQQAADGEFAHSAMIFVIDRDGVIQHRQVGLGADARDLVAAVRAAR